MNCSKGEARRLNLPRGLADLPWEHLDFLGWRDPGAPDRSYLVAEREGGPEAAGGLVGVTLRMPAGVRKSLMKSNVCAVCVTPHPGTGVLLQTAARAGASGRQGNSVGQYMCADLACSLYVRGRKKPEMGGRPTESLTVEERIRRLRANLDAFLSEVLRESVAAG
ncbi:hypothetical protein FHU37_003782 [Allostreptomyces psammosilenae]|uniref:Elongation factor G-binding protein C-terminal treble-clef zinc-finger domain-containing protein n=1 Tax=Allostreptomyces psammosilenae TaxID=1892865 RepID=A0A852ZXB3_9ACTN|nr:hypothetical protein [Allostreptomyces psammosilenae]